MKANKRIFISLILLSGLVMGARGNAILGLGTTTFSEDTLYFGDTLYINTYVVNYGTTDYNDFISFGIKINNVINVNRNIFPNPYTNLTINIPAGDSIAVQLMMIITPAYLAIGPDILVVWPIATDGSEANNELTKQIWVISPVGIDDDPSGGPMGAFYFNNRVVIRSMNPINGINRVRIFDLMGRLVTEQTSDSDSIPFDDQPLGIYIVEVEFINGSTRIFKTGKF